MPSTPVAGRSLGIGLNGLADYSTENPFLDAFRTARNWTTQRPGVWDTQESAQLDVDAQGWVKSLPDPDSPGYTQVGTLLLRDIPDAYPSGRYVVFYDGEGTVNYGFDANKIAAESVPGRDVLQVDSSGGGGIFLNISATDPNNTGNYLRNFRVYREDDLPLVELGITFNPDFTQKIKDFGTLRFMDWMKTNDSVESSWANRPKLNDFSWAPKGAPVEVMVALANETGTSPWFNMPHQATDEYIQQFATYVRDNLDPQLSAYVEFSNEVWNWQFGQSHYALDQAKARWGDAAGGDAWMQWYGMRTAQMSQIWKSTFSRNGQSPTQADRVIAVMGTQTAYRGLEAGALETPLWVAEGNQPAWKYVDAYGVTGYLGGGLGSSEYADTVRSWLSDPDGGFAKAFRQLRYGDLLNGDWKDSLPQLVSALQYQAGVAQRYGLDLVAYEGGQHIVGSNNDEQLTQFFIQINRRPEMRRLYLDILDAWKQAGGKLFNHFVDVGSPSRWGSWGALENLYQTTSPKYSALKTFLANNDRWWDEPASTTKLGLYKRFDATNNTIGGSLYDDILLAGAGDDWINGRAGRDRIHGETGNDRINGSLGDDTLAGGEGDDMLNGSFGADRLIGGQGRDTLTGGEDADRFVYSGFTNTSTSAANALTMSLVTAPDRITDFKFSQGDKFLFDGDHNPAMSDRPTRLFNAGTKTATTLAATVTAAYADKNQSVAGNQPLAANEAVLFTRGSRTYLSINDSTPGFSATSDLVVDVTGMELKLGDATAGTLNVANYFA